MSSGADRIDAGPLTPAEWKAVWQILPTRARLAARMNLPEEEQEI